MNKRIVLSFVAMVIVSGLVVLWNSRSVEEVPMVSIDEKEILESALAGDLEAFQKSFDQERHLSIVDEQGYTLLMLATDSGSRETVEFILQAGADINAELDDHTTALCIAVNAEYVDLVELLISRGANVNVKWGRDQITPLMDAVQNNNMDLVKALLEAGASLDAKDTNGHKIDDYAVSREMKAFLISKTSVVSSENKP